MKIEIFKTELSKIQQFRVQFLHENKFQFIHNKCHLYGWADTYIFYADETAVGYGSVWGAHERSARDCIFEFYVIRPYRNIASVIYSQFCKTPGIAHLEAQTNDLLLSTLLFEYGKNIEAEAILFEDDFNTGYAVNGAGFRKATDEDRKKMGDDDSEYIIEYKGEIAASGGLMLNYNMPYADIYMNVKEPFRGHGLGTLIVQELKKEAYLLGRVPAARCNIRNSISKSTLLKAGFRVCGVLLNAVLKTNDQG
jgi:GNAT superfamily N-acetyltransferase